MTEPTASRRELDQLRDDTRAIELRMNERLSGQANLIGRMDSEIRQFGGLAAQVQGAVTDISELRTSMAGLRNDFLDGNRQLANSFRTDLKEHLDAHADDAVHRREDAKWRRYMTWVTVGSAGTVIAAGVSLLVWLSHHFH